MRELWCLHERVSVESRWEGRWAQNCPAPFPTDRLCFFSVMNSTVQYSLTLNSAGVEMENGMMLVEPPTPPNLGCFVAVRFSLV